MSRRSSIETRLPDDVRARLDFLIGEGKLTIDGLVAWLDSLGHDVPRSTVHRYAKNVKALGEKLRKSDEITKALIREVGPSVADGQQGKLLTQILNTLAFDLLSERLDPDEDADGGATAMELMRLAKFMKDLASAQKIEADRAFKIRQEEATAAAARAKEVMKSRGISADTVAAIEHAVLGVDRSGA